VTIPGLAVAVKSLSAAISADTPANVAAVIV
jgi:hypothetical protein